VAKQSRKAKLLGLGLDAKDGHVRVTRAENFHLVGGSEETHERMQEQCIRFNEKLTQRGKRLENLERQELRELAGECQMNLLLPEEGARHGPETQRDS
jgi:hypothetical protein